MSTNGVVNIINRGKQVEKFKRGPLKFISYLKPTDGKVEFAVYINGGTFIKKFPIRLELEEDQNYIDIQIKNAPDKFTTFMLMHGNYRFWFNLSRGNKRNVSYRLFPTGRLMRIN